MANVSNEIIEKPRERFPALESQLARDGLLEILAGLKAGTIELDLHNGDDAASSDSKLVSAAANPCQSAPTGLKHAANIVKEFADVNDSDFAGQDLSLGRFLGSRFSHANFSGASLKSSDFRWTDLTGVSLRDADLEESVLYGADLSDSDLSNANLIRADLRGVCARGVSFENAKLEGCSFVGADLTDARFSGANFKDADFSFARITPRKFYKVNFGEANYYKADVMGANAPQWPEDPPIENELMMQIKLWLIRRLQNHPKAVRVAASFRLLPIVLL
jgi:uncharacterized protein YjbI with pentapeptide repeats